MRLTLLLPKGLVQISSLRTSAMTCFGALCLRFRLRRVPTNLLSCQAFSSRGKKLGFRDPRAETVAYLFETTMASEPSYRLLGNVTRLKKYMSKFVALLKEEVRSAPSYSLCLCAPRGCSLRPSAAAGSTLFSCAKDVAASCNIQ